MKENVFYHHMTATSVTLARPTVMMAMAFIIVTNTILTTEVLSVPNPLASCMIVLQVLSLTS